MKRILPCLFAIAIAITAYGVEKKDDFKTSPEGVKYKILKANPKGRLPIAGDIILVTSKLKINDSLISENNTPSPMPVSEPEKKGDVNQALLMMHEGESITFAFDPKVFIGDELPPFIKETDIIYLTVDLIKVQSVAEYEAEKVEKERKLLEQESAILEKYIKENNISAKKTSSGLFISVLKEGTGKTPEAGSKVKVHYTGKLLNGSKFDSSVDRGEPFEFQVGIGQVIQGWDEGIMTMKTGEKAVFLIPSSLAYGERDLGVIPANSPLIFEVEMISIGE